MEAPRILVEDGLVLTSYSSMSKPIAYTRSDLVDKLIGYAVHDDDCNLNKAFSTKSCTCGLSDLIKEVRG